MLEQYFSQYYFITVKYFFPFLNVPFLLVELLSSWVSGLYQLYTLLGVTAVLNDSFLGFGSQTRRCYKKKIQRCCIIEVVVFIQINFHILELLLHAEEQYESTCRKLMTGLMIHVHVLYTYDKLLPISLYYVPTWRIELGKSSNELLHHA